MPFAHAARESRRDRQTREREALAGAAAVHQAGLLEAVEGGLELRHRQALALAKRGEVGPAARASRAEDENQE